MKRRRIRQVIQYGWKDAGIIAKYQDVRKSRFSIFLDILRCFRKYYIFSNQYLNNTLWNVSEVEKDQTATRFGEINRVRDTWVDDNYENHLFITKWCSHKWEDSPQKIQTRNKAYTKQYKTGKNLSVQYNVEIRREHFLNGTISIGDNVLLAKNVFIDYSGELVLENNVKLSDGVVIESHSHIFDPNSIIKEAIPSTIVLEDGVWVGQKAIICESSKRIGRYAQIGAGAVVRNPIPPYAIVVGNPAKIVGFLYTPEEVAEFEKEKYPEEERTDIEKYTKLYEKYFINRMSEIKKSLSN